MVPFRCLLLKEYNPALWAVLQNMESHNVIRRDIPELWTRNQLHIVDRLRQKWGLKQFTEEEIHTVCGILEVNSFEIGHSGVSLRALYPSAFLLAHDCVPNTTHIDDEQTFRIVVRASVVIKKGTPITLSYAHTLQVIGLTQNYRDSSTRFIT